MLVPGRTAGPRTGAFTKPVCIKPGRSYRNLSDAKFTNDFGGLNDRISSAVPTTARLHRLQGVPVILMPPGTRPQIAAGGLCRIPTEAAV